MPSGYVAFDLGAESGRAMLAVLENGRLTLDEVHRFPNRLLNLPTGTHWDTTGLWANLVDGLRKAGQRASDRGITLVALGVDTWGVDFALLDEAGELIGLPHAYRDARNLPAMKKALKKVGKPAIWDATGCQFMFLNSLYQVVAARHANRDALKRARHLLFMPDLLHYFFSGKLANEATIASTSQMIDPRVRQGTWATKMLEALDIPTKMLGRIVPAGRKLGRLRKEVAAEAGVERIDVILPGSHDTASAVAAVPVSDEAAASGDWAYISSGTWSLMGAELDRPMITPLAMETGFTNERGVGGKIRFLKNIAGLWLVQEIRRDFARKGQELDYATLTQLASQAEPFRTLIDPAHTPFALPGDMAEKIATFARKTGQPEPQTPGQFVRCCLESLAFCYRATLDQLQMLLGRNISVLHIVGGGGKNALLNQLTADAIGRRVIVGPFEATAIGNALTQAIGTGEVTDLSHLRKVVRDSFQPHTVEPMHTDGFEALRPRYDALVGTE